MQKLLWSGKGTLPTLRDPGYSASYNIISARPSIVFYTLTRHSSVTVSLHCLPCFTCFAYFTLYSPDVRRAVTSPPAVRRASPPAACLTYPPALCCRPRRAVTGPPAESCQMPSRGGLSHIRPRCVVTCPPAVCCHMSHVLPLYAVTVR